MNKLAKRKQKGFTLIELIAVIAIIGILAAVLVPRVLGYMNDAKDSKVISQARNVRMAYETMISKGKVFTGDESAVTVSQVAAEYGTPTVSGINWKDYMSVEASDYDQLQGSATMKKLKDAATQGKTAFSGVKK